MSTECEARHAILFEPVRIGPVTAPNRFYQVPHCSGMGYNHPRTLAAMRGMKAAGGWGTVCTEYCSIHPAWDESPHHTASIWDADDVRNLALLTDAVHEHGSLAGIELWAGGTGSPNLLTRTPSPAPRSLPAVHDPVQSRAMDRADIRRLREWHRAAVRRAREADFDIVYVYACHGYLLSQVLSRAWNTRTDEYGGNLENRLRLVRELLTDTREEAGDRMAVAIRFSADGYGTEHMDADEARNAIGHLAEMPDLWDLTIGDYSREMGVSRFHGEGALEAEVSRIRELTTRPIVSVGRFTSPDTMASLVRRGVLDLVGAARPSIADPFLPEKIRSGRSTDIRECIGCNICYASDDRAVPLQCTQNPTMGQEWSRGWHPEVIADDGNGELALVVGAGPAGLEAALVLARRGFRVTVAEATRECGGRVSRESRLPGLGEWARVRDYRLGQLRDRVNVEFFLDSRMSADDVIEFGARHTIIATGAKWRADGTGRLHASPLAELVQDRVLTPDDIMDGFRPEGRITIFDDDHYYMGCVLAELLVERGCSVTLVTGAALPGGWMVHTVEQYESHRRLLVRGVHVVCNTRADGFDGQRVYAAHTISDETFTLPADYLLLVTSREPCDALYAELYRRHDELPREGSLRRAGDCDAPGIIATAVHSGHAAARDVAMVPAHPLRDRPVAAAAHDAP